VYALATLLDPRYKGRLFAPDKLEAIKQWSIDEARFEPSNPPVNTPQSPPAKKARDPLDVLDHGLRVCISKAVARRHTVCASVHLICISRVTGGCLIVHVAAKYLLLAAEAEHYLSTPPMSAASERVFSS